MVEAYFTFGWRSVQSRTFLNFAGSANQVLPKGTIALRFLFTYFPLMYPHIRVRVHYNLTLAVLASCMSNTDLSVLNSHTAPIQPA